MKNRNIFIIIIVLQILIIGVIFLFPQQMNTSKNLTKQSITEATNNERKHYKLPSLNYNLNLEAAAYERAEDILRNQDFSHFIPNEEDPWKHIENQGYNYVYAAENLGINYANVSELMNAWMDSETHKNNILSNKAKDIGIAIMEFTQDNEKKYLVVQIFGSTKTRE